MIEREIFSGYRVGKATGGDECEALERELESYYRVPYARVFNSATTALYAAIVSRRIVHHRESERLIRVPGYSMSATAAAAIHAGYKIRWEDIGDDYCLEKLGSASGAQVSVLVHLFGHHAARRTYFTVHDCAQSPSVRPDEKYGHRDMWVYSLNQWKIVTSGEGGYVLTFDEDMAGRLHAVRNHGECFTEDILGWNFRMTEMQGAIARREFAQLDRRLDARREWAYQMQTKNNLPPDPGNIDWFLYPVRVKDESERKHLAASIDGARIGYHKPIYKLPYFAKRQPGISRTNIERIEEELVVINPMEYGL